MRFATEADIAVPPEQAFDAMADARNETRWNSQVSSSELVSDEPVALGSRFRTVNRGQTYDATITRHDRPRDLAFEVTGKGMDISAAFRFEAAGAATHLTSTFDMRPKGPMKVMFALLRPVVRRDLDRQTQNFRAMCEGR